MRQLDIQYLKHGGKGGKKPVCVDLQHFIFGASFIIKLPRAMHSHFSIVLYVPK